MLETSIAVSMVIGLTEVIKRSSGLPSRFAPLVSLIVGMGIVFLGEAPLKETIISGITIGLMASGLYSGIKKTITG